MRVVFECPCEYWRERGFPPDIGYVCYAPGPSVALRDLLAMGEAFVRPAGVTTVIPLRQYDGRQSMYTFDIDRVEAWIRGRRAEAYALVGCSDLEILRTTMQHTNLADEAALVTCLAGHVLAFFHEGHPSLELTGPPSQLREYAIALLRDWKGTENGIVPSNLRKEEANGMNR
jgi:hypothetical protein